MKVSSNFDSGNIEVVNCDDPSDIRLRIRYDAGEEFFQWFHFRLSGAKDLDCRLVIENAGEASYVAGWEGYQACASYDRETWFRVDTEFDGKNLIIRHMPQLDSVYFAYFAPYSRERHHDLIARSQMHPRCSHEVLGETLDGEDMDLLVIGNEDDEQALKIWAIARQHPGETMAEWWMEGFIGRLLDETDPIARDLLKRAVFYVVPNMNPDGSRRGHLRTNAAGANLNREWADPTLERSPEVYHVDQEMREVGLDFCLDVHGDEGLPYNFIAGADAIPDCPARLIELRERYEAALERANPDFQREHGYPKKAPGQANLTMGSAHIQHTHQALAMTLEMPFKDNANDPDYFQGWSPERCMKLGHSCLDALHHVIEDLRG